VSAEITDNAQGAVDVTFSPAAPSYSAALRGNNSYSGTTYVNTGTLYVANPGSLPDGADLQIAGGNVALGFTTTSPTHLGSIRIALDGTLGGSNATLSFDELILEDGTFQAGTLVGNAPVFKRTIGDAAIGAASTASTYNGDVTVEQGKLTAGGLHNAKFRVEGGTLVLITAPNNITLAGGTLEYLYLTGNISVTAPSRIIAKPRDNATNYGLAGSFSGDADLTFENRPAPRDSGNVTLFSAAAPPAYVRGHSPAFHGNIHIDSATVAIANEDSLGTGDIFIRPDGTLVLAPLQGNFAGAKLDLPNTVHLDGGELSGVSSVFRPQRLLGELYVTGNSQIGTLEVLGAARLADGSRLTTTEHYETRFTSDVLIGGTAEFYVGRIEIRSSALEANRGIVQLGGRIVSDAAVSMLKIESAGLDDLRLGSSYFVKPGQSLGILYRDELIELSVAGGSISGGGTLLNPVRVDQGGRLSPGDSGL
jgi:autotransporter-associated beta strand protein